MSRSTIREVRAVIVETSATHTDPVQAFRDSREMHAIALQDLSEHYAVREVGPVAATGDGTTHPFASILLAIACGAQIERTSYVSGEVSWCEVAAEEALRMIAEGLAFPGDLRAK